MPATRINKLRAQAEQAQSSCEIPRKVSQHKLNRLKSMLSMLELTDTLSDYVLRYLLSPPSTKPNEEYAEKLKKQAEDDESQLERLSEIEKLLLEILPDAQTAHKALMDDISAARMQISGRVACMRELLSRIGKARMEISMRRRIQIRADKQQAKAKIAKPKTKKRILNAFERRGFIYDDIIYTVRGLFFNKPSPGGDTLVSFSRVLEAVNAEYDVANEKIISAQHVLAHDDHEILSEENGQYAIKKIPVSPEARQAAKNTLAAMKKRIAELNGLMPVLEYLKKNGHMFRPRRPASAAHSIVAATRKNLAQQAPSLQTQDGGPITGCTVDQARPEKKRPSNRQQIALKALAKLVAEEGKLCPGKTCIDICDELLNKYEVIGKPRYTEKHLAGRVATARGNGEWEKIN